MSSRWLRDVIWRAGLRVGNTCLEFAIVVDTRCFGREM